MWTSLRAAQSGMLAQQRALDVAADNLTKMQIPGQQEPAGLLPRACP